MNRVLEIPAVHLRELLVRCPTLNFSWFLMGLVVLGGFDNKERTHLCTSTLA